MFSEALHGYADRLSTTAGDVVAFRLHSAGDAPIDASLVRYVAGADGEIGTVPAGPVVTSAAPAREQSIDAGSCVVVEDRDDRFGGEAGITVALRVWFAALPASERTLAGRWDAGTQAGYAVTLGADGRLSARVGDGQDRHELRADEPLAEGGWHEIAWSWDPASGRLALGSRLLAAVGNRHGYAHLGATSRCATGASPCAPIAPAGGPLVFGAHVVSASGPRRYAGHFTGKVEAPAVWRGARDLERLLEDRATAGAPQAHWNLAAGIGRNGASGDLIPDVAGGPPAVLRNGPARAVTGSGWTGAETDFRIAADHYAAVHLHEHDLEDAGWPDTFRWTVPPDLPSGVYGMSVRSRSGEDCIPIVVRPAAQRARIAVVLPTATYMAYANDHMAFDAAGTEQALAHTPVVEAVHCFLDAHREYGLALYDRHADGSAVMFSSRLRPILSMRHDFSSASSGRTWGLKADLQLTSWLDRGDYDYDVLTDEDLHRDGAEALRGYAAVLTGAHPEYVSARMLDGYEGYVAGGGRLLYLGGNGFWWVTAFHPDKPHVIEVRRGEAGAHWDVAAGEARNATTGEPGGLWSGRGRPGQRLVGVGYGASGFDFSSPYRRTHFERGTDAAALLDGMDEAWLGAYGTAGGGAAGLELDFADVSLGTPPDALILASSEGHSNRYLGAGADAVAATSDTSGRYNPRVRADLVLFDVPGGGGVFSVGSIAWISSLGHDGDANDVSRLTARVIDAALERGAVRLPAP